jgi:hypothetical protein
MLGKLHLAKWEPMEYKKYGNLVWNKHRKSLGQESKHYNSTSSVNSVHVQCVMSLTKDYDSAVTISGMENVWILVIDVEVWKFLKLSTGYLLDWNLLM